MTRRRWIADEASGDRAAIMGDHADHLVRVLRARVGEEFDIATGKVVRRGTIRAVIEGRVEFELGEEISASTLTSITLLLAVFKFDRMEWAIEKCTELGVARIVPILSRRTDSHLASAAAKRVERWQRLSKQASEQSRRTSPPEIDQPIKLRDALHLFPGLRIVLAESKEKNLLRDVMNQAESSEGVVLAIGPEGGWTDDEMQLFRQAGWRAASLGHTILRAETAAIAATVVMVSTLLDS